MNYRFATLEEAECALREAEPEYIAEAGAQAWEDGYGDIVRATAEECPPAVAQELCRRCGVEWKPRCR